MNEEKHIYNDEIDLMEIFLVLWNAKWKIVGATIIAAFLVI